MIRFDRTHTEEDSELFQITAMVDVVFILLAFFVLSVRFHGQERDLAMSHRETSSAITSTAQDMPNQIIIRVDRAEDGVQMTLGATVLPIDGFDALTYRLEQINLPELTVVLTADPRLSVDQVARVVEAVLASPMQRMSLAELPGVEP